MDGPDAQDLARTVTDGLSALQIAQRAYDAAMWDIADDALANARHILIHLSITVGKLARILEPLDHAAYHGDVRAPHGRDLPPIVADLMIHAAQLANLGEVDLGDSLVERYRGNAARFAPESPLSEFGRRTDE